MNDTWARLLTGTCFIFHIKKVKHTSSPSPPSSSFFLLLLWWRNELSHLNAILQKIICMDRHMLVIRTDHWLVGLFLILAHLKPFPSFLIPQTTDLKDHGLTITIPFSNGNYPKWWCFRVVGFCIVESVCWGFCLVFFWGWELVLVGWLVLVLNQMVQRNDSVSLTSLPWVTESCVPEHMTVQKKPVPYP